MENPELSSAIYWLGWIKWVEHFSAFLVVVGVAGELLTSLVSGRFEQVIEYAWQSEIAQANARAAEANKIAEQERHARLKIEERLADRVLTDEQVESIANKVRPFVGQEYGVTTYWDLREPLALANRIHESLTLAGWKYVKPERETFLMGGQEGIEVYVHPEADTWVKDAATFLIEALAAARIEAEMKQQNAPNNPNNKIYLKVGTKPQ